MAFRFPMMPYMFPYKGAGHSSPFKVKDVQALALALKHYPNISVYDHGDGEVHLTSEDGTWYTGFAGGEEACILDEILLPLLIEGEVVHLYRIFYTNKGVEGDRYSLAVNGQWHHADFRALEAMTAHQLLNA